MLEPSWEEEDLLIELFNEDERGGHGKEQKKAEFDSTGCQLQQGEEKKQKKEWFNGEKNLKACSKY